MSLLTKNFTYNVKKFKDHLSTLKKSLASANGNRRVYFNSITMNCLLGVLYYFGHAFNTYYMIPNIDEVDDNLADLHGKRYNAFLPVLN